MVHSLSLILNLPKAEDAHCRAPGSRCFVRRGHCPPLPKGPAVRVLVNHSHSRPPFQGSAAMLAVAIHRGYAVQHRRLIRKIRESNSAVEA